MSVPNKTQNQNNKPLAADEMVKFVAPRQLKSSLQQLAQERNISLSALMRLVTSEYVKRHPTT